MYLSVFYFIMRGQFTEENMRMSNKYMLIGYITSRQQYEKVSYHNTIWPTYLYLLAFPVLPNTHSPPTTLALRLFFDHHDVLPLLTFCYIEIKTFHDHPIWNYTLSSQILPSSLLSFFIFLMAFITTWHTIDWLIDRLSIYHC